MENKSNSTIVRECYRKIIRDLDLTLVDTYVREDYIQHNPTVPTGKQGLLDMLAFLKSLPKPAEEGPSPIVRMITEGDLVAVHLDIKFMGKRVAVIDLFRLENSQLAEHWDVAQDITAEEEGPITMTNGTTAIDETVSGLESKKIVERLFFGLAAIAVSDKYLLTDFIEHNPSSGLLNTLNHLIKVHKVLAEGDFVVAHCELSKADKAFSHFSIFRMAHGKIAEHWGIDQEVPEKMAHQNGMF